MLNDISSKQNIEENIELLAAMRSVYSEAKIYHGIDLFVCIFGVLLATVSINYIFEPNSIMNWAPALYSILITVFSRTVIKPHIENNRLLGAKIQNLFDCNVLSIPWDNLTYGSKPSRDRIRFYASKLLTNHVASASLDDWYSTDISKLPLHKARIQCQYENLNWETGLRESYHHWIVSISIISAIGLLIYAISSNITVASFCKQFILPCMPIAMVLHDQINNNKSTIKAYNDLKDHVESYLSGNSSNLSYDYSFSISLQRKIFEFRKSNILIFDFFYTLYHSKLHTNMMSSIKRAIQKFIK